MRMIVAAPLLAGAVLLLGGCSSSSNPDAKGRDAVGNRDMKGVAGSNFAARFEAARAMMIVSDRDAALAKVAEDAAQAGDAETVQKCLREIRVVDVRDDAAYKAALGLAKSGKADAGTDVAKSIMVVSRRDEALSKLAKGEFGK